MANNLRRSIKMNRELWIKNTIEKVLEPAGFSYVGRLDGISSKFFRKVKNSKGEVIRQIVSLQDSQYHNMIYLNLHSTRHHAYQIHDFVPDCTEHGLYFENEEEYKKAIEQFADILMKYGLPFLEKIKEPILSDYFVDEDMEKLFYEHENLLESLIRRENIQAEEFNVEQAAEFIEKKVEEVKEKSFEEVRNLLLELSALFGAVANQFHPCQWRLKETMVLRCGLEFLKVKNDWNEIIVADILLSGWKEKEKNGNKEDVSSSEKEENKSTKPWEQFMNLNVTYPPRKIKEELLKEYNKITFPFTREEVLNMGFISEL